MKMNENCMSFIFIQSNLLLINFEQQFLQKTRSLKRVPQLKEMIHIAHFDVYIGTLFMT